MKRLLEGHPAEDIARLCFSKLRFLPIPLKDALRRDGLWEDLAQELYRIALDGWHQGMEPREMGGTATRELRAFLKAYGYQRRQGQHDGFVKPETPLSAICAEEKDGWERVCAESALSAPTSDGLEKAILALLGKHPEGLSLRQVNAALKRQARAAVVADHCARLVVRGVIRETARSKGRGRQPSPMLGLAEPP